METQAKNPGKASEIVQPSYTLITELSAPKVTMTANTLSSPSLLWPKGHIRTILTVSLFSWWEYQTLSCPTSSTPCYSIYWITMAKLIISDWESTSLLIQQESHCTSHWHKGWVVKGLMPGGAHQRNWVVFLQKAALWHKICYCLKLCPALHTLLHSPKVNPALFLELLSGLHKETPSETAKPKRDEATQG